MANIEEVDYMQAVDRMVESLGADISRVYLDGNDKNILLDLSVAHGPNFWSTPQGIALDQEREYLSENVGQIWGNSGKTLVIEYGTPIFMVETYTSNDGETAVITSEDVN